MLRLVGSGSQISDFRSQIANLRTEAQVTVSLLRSEICDLRS